MWTLPFLFLTRQGRRDIEMTMHYLDVTLNDLQRTFELARYSLSDKAGVTSAKPVSG